MLSYEGDRVTRIEEKFVGLARNENQLQVDLIRRYLPGGHFLPLKQTIRRDRSPLPLKQFLPEENFPKPQLSRKLFSGQSTVDPSLSLLTWDGVPEQP